MLTLQDVFCSTVPSAILSLVGDTAYTTSGNWSYRIPHLLLRRARCDRLAKNVLRWGCVRYEPTLDRDRSCKISFEAIPGIDLVEIIVGTVKKLVHVPLANLANP